MSLRLSFSSLRDDFAEHLKDGLVEKPLFVSCWRCRRTTPSDLKWVCPHCNFANQRTQLYSFLNGCQQCGSHPAGIECPHCNAVISDERGTEFIAVAFVPKRPLPPKEDPALRERATHERRKLQLDRDIEIAEREARLSSERSKIKTPESDEKKRDREVSAYVANVMGYHKSIQRARQQAEKDYANDSDGLERVLMALKEFEESKIRL
jgi:hypothetical protein